LTDLWRGKVDNPTLKAKVLMLAKLSGARRVLVEDTAAGAALVQELKSQISGIIA
jgi:phage terminase large subunit-like protein